MPSKCCCSLAQSMSACPGRRMAATPASRCAVPWVFASENELSRYDTHPQNNLSVTFIAAKHNITCGKRASARMLGLQACYFSARQIVSSVFANACLLSARIACSPFVAQHSRPSLCTLMLFFMVDTEKMARSVPTLTDPGPAGTSTRTE